MNTKHKVGDLVFSMIHQYKQDRLFRLGMIARIEQGKWYNTYFIQWVDNQETIPFSEEVVDSMRMNYRMYRYESAKVQSR
jgi:hypothetical protein